MLQHKGFSAETSKGYLLNKIPKIGFKKGLIGLIGSILLFAAGCDDMEKATYKYADGNGNRYLISGQPHTLEYIPIKPQNSSSGFYDGGTAVKKKLSDADFQQILSLFRQALEQPVEHITMRLMGSGSLQVTFPDKEVSVILKPASPAQRNIETALKKLL